MPAYICAWLCARITAVIPYEPTRPSTIPATLPMMHIVTLLAHWTKRRRKPALGLREKQWWSVLGVIFVALILLSLIANWTIGVPLRERAAAAGYIECGSLFDREDRQRVRATYALSADLCRQAGFKRSRIEPDFDTPRSPG